MRAVLTCVVPAVAAAAVLCAAFAGCGEQSTDPDPVWDIPYDESGTIIVVPKPDSIDAYWSLSGPDGLGLERQGADTLPEMPCGVYEIEWGVVSGYCVLPDTACTLRPCWTIMFEATYSPQPPPQTLVLIPAGRFVMGSEENGSQHTVELTTPFWMLSTEVTNRQFVDMAEWAEDNGYCSYYNGGQYDDAWHVLDMMGGVSRAELLILERSDIQYRYSEHMLFVDADKEDLPVTGVTWYGAAAYCDWLNMYEGLAPAYDHSTWLCNGHDPYGAEGYRLPTEAEWEYACRAGTQTPFYTGDCLTSGTEANFDGTRFLSGCPAGPYLGRTAPVASYPANRFGLFDMSGNIEEWCNDWNGSYGGFETDPAGPSTGASRIVRGGDYSIPMTGCSSASRRADDPMATYLGFRIVRSAL